MILWLGAAAAASLLLYPVWVVHRQTLGHHERIEHDPSEWGAPFESIEHTAEDGVRLKGWWIPGRSHKAVLLIHGNRGSRNGYHSGIFELGAWYWRRGFHVMMVDLRAHGESGGERISFGIREHADLLGWVERLDPECAYAWHLHGFSMGASTALMMMERRPERFRGALVDASWIDFHALARQELWRRAHLPALLYPYVRWIARTFFGIDFEAADNKERCRRLCGRAVLYIFEENDTLVTSFHRRLLQELCPAAEILLFEHSGHVDAFKECPDRYTEAIDSFLASLESCGPEK
ncbi:alpha/beta hydrolase [Hydrogenimonas sp.]